MADYLILSTTVIDSIEFADGSRLDHVIGGAGIYALAGARVWANNVLLLSGIGADYLPLFGDWYARNGLETTGLTVRDKSTIRNKIQYFSTDHRTETPFFGVEHYRKMEPTAADLEAWSPGVRGVYIFRDSDPRFWAEVGRIQRTGKFSILWELNADAAYLDNLAQVRTVAESVAVFSLNVSEAASLLGQSDTGAIVAELQRWRVPMIFLRAGASGSYAIFDGRAVFVPSVQGVKVVDVTGGGNSSSGAALVGYCETGDPVAAAAMGNVSASLCIAQFGVPETISAEVGEGARRLLGQVLPEVHCEER